MVPHSFQSEEYILKGREVEGEKKDRMKYAGNQDPEEKVEGSWDERQYKDEIVKYSVWQV